MRCISSRVLSYQAFFDTWVLFRHRRCLQLLCVSLLIYCNRIVAMFGACVYFILSLNKFLKFVLHLERVSGNNQSPSLLGLCQSRKLALVPTLHIFIRDGTFYFLMVFRKLFCNWYRTTGLLITYAWYSRATLQHNLHHCYVWSTITTDGLRVGDSYFCSTSGYLPPRSHCTWYILFIQSCRLTLNLHDSTRNRHSVHSMTWENISPRISFIQPQTYLSDRITTTSNVDDFWR
jgi:hypothetical protein